MGLSVGDKTVSEFTVGNTPIKQGADEGNLFRGKNKKTFSYTGGEQSFTIPTDGYYILECWGAQGGSSSGRATRAGGNGGYAKGKVYLTAGTVLKIYVGEKGKDNTGGLTDVAFNGGGKGGYSNYQSSNDRNGGGGGGTDIRIGGNTLYHRLIVAGGGAGGHAYSDYTSVIYGGGENGGVGGGDRGGTQTGGGGFGVGGSSSSNGEGNRWCMNGGGGGWYGGMGQARSSHDNWYNDFVSGGGSGFVWTGQDTVPSGYLVSENYVLDETENIAGNESMPNYDGTGTMVGNIGNGCVVITCYLGSKGEKVTEAGIYHNPDLGLISMSADGENWITISDKNAEAWSDDIEDELSYGGYFQFGNIHGFGALPEPVPPEPPEPTPPREPGEHTLFYFEFENNLNDSSGKGNNATGSSGIGYEQIGGEYVVKTTTGSSPYITLDPAVGRNIGSGDFAISLWLYPKSTNGTPMVFGTFAEQSPFNGPTIFYNHNSTNKICFRLRGDNEQYVDAVSVDTRHHLVFTRINGVCYVYVDNVKKLEFSDNSSWTGATMTYLLSRPSSTQWFSNAGVMMDKFIYEDQGREVSKVGEYYNWTKSAYGIN